MPAGQGCLERETRSPHCESGCCPSSVSDRPVRTRKRAQIWRRPDHSRRRISDRHPGHGHRREHPTSPSPSVELLLRAGGVGAMRIRWSVGRPEPLLRCRPAYGRDCTRTEAPRPFPLRPAGDERRRSWPVLINICQKLDRITAAISQPREKMPEGPYRALVLATGQGEPHCRKQRNQTTSVTRPGRKRMRTRGPSERDKSSWDKVDEAEDRSFPASDPPALLRDLAQ